MRGWEKRAACVGQYQLFFPEDNEDSERRDIREGSAKALCWICRVREDCLAWAMLNPRQASEGVWGGHSARDREHLRRRRSWNEYQQSLLVPA